MTRQLFVYELAKLDGVNIGKYAVSSFSDVPDGAWYTASVEWAAENGIIEGVGDNVFAPVATITREQMVVMLDRYIKYKKYELTPAMSANVSADDNKINSWAKDAVGNIQKLGIIIGRPGNIFDPQALATRAEVATIFANYINIYMNHSFDFDAIRTDKFNRSFEDS